MSCLVSQLSIHNNEKTEVGTQRWIQDGEEGGCMGDIRLPPLQTEQA